ncbi:MAG: hypothetical protein U9O53_05130 [archaeon]|nr:hypothetical protein [archaeon]
MIEYLFAVTLAVGSVIFATISIGDLVEKKEMTEVPVMDIPAEAIGRLMKYKGNIEIKDGYSISCKERSGSVNIGGDNIIYIISPDRETVKGKNKVVYDQIVFFREDEGVDKGVPFVHIKGSQEYFGRNKNKDITDAIQLIEGLGDKLKPQRFKQYGIDAIH